MPNPDLRPQIAVVDYDMGNLHSVCKGLETVGAAPLVTDQYEQLQAAAAVILPGVGAFDPAIQRLRSHDLVQPLRDVAASGKPFLGICLGLQILFDGSEEGAEMGLGIVPGWVRRFQSEPGLTIPHMGWNALQFTQPDCPLWQQLTPQEADAATHPVWAYFVHTYYVEPTDPTVVAATVTHGQQCVTAAVANGNLMATQFHPEKSSHAGLQILANFVEFVRHQQLVPA
ncbi:MAG: imidazole glycerol phosphate synthase subunit HisH [Cyanobacteria bacterium P01_H01_bin.121]